MPTTQDFIAETLKYQGVTYNAIGTQSCGANCLGIWALILSSLGGFDKLVLELEAGARYSRPTSTGELMRGMVRSNYLEDIRPIRKEVGHLLLFRVAGEPQHLALIVEPGIIFHADNDPTRRRTNVQGLPNDWPIAKEFRLVGLTDD